MKKSNKDIVTPVYLNNHILTLFEQGLPVKKIQAGISHMTTDAEGGCCQRGTPRK